jgi:hypothetical protein
MIITLLLGNKYYRIHYDYKRIGEIFAVAVGLYVVFVVTKSDHRIYNLLIGTLVLGIFIFYSMRREKLITIFFRKSA